MTDEQELQFYLIVAIHKEAMKIFTWVLATVQKDQVYNSTIFSEKKFSTTYLFYC